MIRLDDPNAAEQIAAEFVRAVYQNQALTSWPLHSQKPMIRGAEAVIAAIEVPRLPTRSEVRTVTQQQFPGDFGRAVEGLIFMHGWAVEDPEPEVDPAQVEALAKLIASVNDCEWPPAHPADGPEYRREASALLASGRVSVKADG